VAVPLAWIGQRPVVDLNGTPLGDLKLTAGGLHTNVTVTTAPEAIKIWGNPDRGMPPTPPDTTA
jgi:hypothetical protein